MNSEFILAIDQIEKEKGISKEVLMQALTDALISAYRKNFGTAQNVKVDMNPETGDIHVYAQKDVVEVIEDELLHISIEDAKKKNPIYGIGDVIDVEVTPKDFGRIAAQTAKQVVVQKIREFEREMIYEEYSQKENDVITGIIQRVDKGNVIIDFGKVEGMLPAAETVKFEKYETHGRIKVYVVEVKKTSKGPQITLSRTHPGLVKRLFELEVPEIFDGSVEIMSVSREAGSRTKFAVRSTVENVDPIGACVGQRGDRVNSVVEELNGEKIDIIKWSKEPKEYISSSLSPSKVTSIEVNENDKTAKVIVPDYQLSLAIGKEGQNARLAAKLTGWKIDIKSESQANTSK